MMDWLQNWYAVAAAAAGVLGLILIFLLFLRRRRRTPDIVDGHDFENFCSEVLEHAGFSSVEQTPASGDFGVDILAVKDGVTWAFQCKYYDKPVGTKAVQEVYSGRDFYHCMVGAVMTNNEYTKNAIKMAEELNILLWDGEYLSELLEGRE